jgi:hypothetical protein
MVRRALLPDRIEALKNAFEYNGALYCRSQMMAELTKKSLFKNHFLIFRAYV